MQSGTKADTWPGREKRYHSSREQRTGVCITPDAGARLMTISSAATRSARMGNGSWGAATTSRYPQAEIPADGVIIKGRTTLLVCCLEVFPTRARQVANLGPDASRTWSGWGLLRLVVIQAAGRHATNSRMMNGDEAATPGALDNEVVPLPARHELSAPAPDIDSRSGRASPSHDTLLVPADIPRSQPCPVTLRRYRQLKLRYLDHRYPPVTCRSR